ncbi:hypothetical protein FJZ31_37655 [Candidatus Poribacteria bacterium]|nr:hypothetical protein [Candidatus Poribacteria bacterium]
MMLETSPEHPLEQIAQVFDTTHKEIWGSHPEKVVRLLGIEKAEGMRIAEKNVELRKTFALDVDLAFWVEYPDGRRWILHLEFERETKKITPKRMFQYNVLLALCNDEGEKTPQFPVVESYLVYFWPSTGQSDPGVYHHGENLFRYHKLFFYDLTLEAIEAAEFWELLAFAPCLRDIKPDDIREIQRKLKEHIDNPDALHRLLIFLAFYFKKRYNKSITSVIKEYDVMATEKATALERWAEYEQMRGMERGRIEGLTEGLTKGRIETLRAQLQNIHGIYSDQIAQLLAAPLRSLALHEAIYILERALEGRDDAFYARVKGDVLAILNGRR